MTIIWEKEVEETSFKLHQIPILEDRFAYILAADKHSILFDPVDADRVVWYVEEHHLTPEVCLITHHLRQQSEMTQALKKKYGIPIFAPAHEEAPYIDNDVEDGDELTTGKFEFCVMHTPGHGGEATSYHFPALELLFTGGFLSVLGCGKLFEANEYQYFDSLQAVKGLPENTLIMPDCDMAKENIAFIKWMHPNSSEVDKFTNDTFSSIMVEKQFNPYFSVATPIELLGLFSKHDQFTAKQATS